MNDKWDNRTTAKFIEVYKYHQCLWNVKHGLYKDRDARDAAYSNIIYEMAKSRDVHMTVKAVREKIRSLRNTFINEIKKIEEAKMMGAGVYTPRLRWFESMMFLRQADDVRCVRESTICQTENSITITKVPENESITITRLPDTEIIRNYDRQADNTPELNIMEPVVNLTEVTNGHHRPLQQETHLHSLSLPFNTNTESMKSAKIVEEDEFDAFGRNVALQLKTLPLIAALQSQETIQRLLREQRIKALQGPSAPPPSNHSREDEVANDIPITINVPAEIPMLTTTVKVEIE